MSVMQKLGIQSFIASLLYLLVFGTYIDSNTISDWMVVQLVVIRKFSSIVLMSNKVLLSSNIVLCTDTSQKWVWERGLEGNVYRP